MKISKIPNSAETRLFRTHRGKIDPGEAENSVKTACHENRDFCKTLEIRTRRGKIDPADFEFQGLVPRNGQKHDFKTCNFLDGSGFSKLVICVLAEVTRVRSHCESLRH